MNSVGWFSILPPIVAIALAIITRQVYLSLGLFVWLGWTILNGWNPVDGLIQSVDVFVSSVTRGDNARTLMFSVLIGAMITLTQASGGMQGFIDWVDRRRLASSKRSAGLVAAIVSMGVFLESNFGLLVSGSIARPLVDRCRVSREKLSYIIDATCAPKCILIPLNAWGAYVIGLLSDSNVREPVALVVAALPLNFYAILAILQAFIVILVGWHFGPMREAERRVEEDGKVLRDGAEPMMSTDVVETRAKSGIPARAINMVGPILAMVLAVPWVLWLTGSEDATTNRLMSGNGSQAVLWGVIIGLLVAAVSYKAQRIMTIKEMTELGIKGVQGLVPLVIVLALAFTIGATQRALGTGVFLAQAAEAALNPGFIPAIIFMLACFIAFSTGTSWGTFAIMVPIVIPMTQQLDLHPALTLSAALGGGIFGDHCSPISDSTIVASMASATDHIDHVRTQLPYALVAAGGAVALFLVFGFVL